MKRTLLLATAFGFLLFPQRSHAQAPALGSAANFVLFSSGGAVGNTGARSHFTGDIGTSVGDITINVNVNGVLRYEGSGPSLQAAIDVLSASNQIDSTIPTSTRPPSPALVDSLGGNDTLLAGVYAFTQKTLLDSALILDAQGDPNKVFIFKIQGPLSATPTANIVLANGALACNVFWQTSGAVNLGAGSIMRGTIIAKSALINMEEGATLEGRALTSTAGAITTTNVLTYTPTGCGSPVHLGPAAPALASVACYVLFSTNGTVSNSGETHLIGDVGTNFGTTAGYDSSFVNGNIHPAPDTSTSQAAADLNTLHTTLSTQTEDIQLLFPAQFGQNLVLTPHTYLLNAATSLTDTLYLNAEGNPNAVFLIKVVGALSTSVKARVILTNGTKASNVFWHVGGALSISDSSIMHGTFVVNNGAIIMKIGSVLEGRALTTTGALTTAAVTASVPVGTCSSITPLPVGLLYFGGKLVQGSVLLQWTTTEAINGGRFLVERSSDGRNFETLGFVTAGSKSGQSEYRYSFTDAHPLTQSYYRLLQEELNGTRSYSRTISVNTSGAFTASAFAAQSAINVELSGAAKGTGTIMLYTVDGRKVAEQEITLTPERSVYTVEKPSQTGIYLLFITCNGQKLFTEKLLID